MSKTRTYADVKAELDAIEADALTELAAAKEAYRADRDDEAARDRLKAAKDAVVELRSSQREGREGMSVTATNDTAQEG